VAFDGYSPLLEVRYLVRKKTSVPQDLRIELRGGEANHTNSSGSMFSGCTNGIVTQGSLNENHFLHDSGDSPWCCITSLFTSLVGPLQKLDHERRGGWEASLHLSLTTGRSTNALRKQSPLLHLLKLEWQHCLRKLIAECFGSHRGVYGLLY
jgi:hypothetical protein